jgi:hypothetical protein
MHVATNLVLPPVMTREAWANVIGLPIGVVDAQASRGLWPVVTIGKYSLINVAAVNLLALQAATKNTKPSSSSSGNEFSSTTAVGRGTSHGWPAQSNFLF